FFSELRYTFSTLSPLLFNEIHSEQFLSTCEQYFELIDKLNGTTFNTFRSDAIDNINVSLLLINFCETRFTRSVEVSR
ncbi:unnamed protein product, partial [Rotaria sordida]